MLESKLFYIILLSVVLGSASGVLGTAITSSYLSSYTLQVNELTQPIQLNVERPKSFPNSYTDAIARFSETSEQSVVSVFPKSALTQNGYLQDSSLATGVVVTSDGWIIAPYFQHTASVPLVVHVKNEVFDVTNTVVDSLTQTIFLKCSGNNLPVVGFGSAFALIVGDQLFASTHARQFVHLSVLDQGWQQGMTLSSDVPSRRLLLSENTFKKTIPIFNLSGLFVGFGLNSDDQTLLVPFDEILPSFNRLLEKKELKHPSLGLMYLDLAHTVGISDAISRKYKQGALVTKLLAMKKGNTAQRTDVREGDIILSINGQELDSKQGLNEILMKLQAGESVLIMVDRAGEKKNITVVLGEYTK